MVLLKQKMNLNVNQINYGLTKKNNLKTTSCKKG